MATEYSTKKITELEAKTPADTDILAVGGAGGAILKKFTLATLATWIRTKVAGFTFALNSGTKTLVAGINDILASTGDVTYTYAGAGYITTSGTLVTVTIPTNRVINGVSIGNAVCTNLQLRQNGNTLYASSDPTDVEISAATSGFCGIRLSIYKNSGGSHVSWGGTNNDAVGIQVSFTITWE